MKGIVVRNAVHQGVRFIEVKEDVNTPLVFSLPADAEIPLGTRVEVVVTILPAEAPTEEEAVVIPAEEAPATEKTGALPDDFPGRVALEAAGIDTYEEVHAQIAGDGLTALDGIGDATATKIEEALN